MGGIDYSKDTTSAETLSLGYSAATEENDEMMECKSEAQRLRHKMKKMNLNDEEVEQKPKTKAKSVKR